MISNKSYFLLACFTYRGLFSYAEEASSKKNLVPAFVPIKEAFDQCSNGLIGEYPCSMIDLDAFLPNNQISGSQDKRTNDLWGWTDPSSGKEYAIVGFRDGTAFVDISTPTSPMYLGFLPAHTGTSSMWRDIKTYGDYAYIVADEIGHGMQIFDLKQLSSVFNAPVIFRESAHFEINFQGSMKSKSEINFDRYYDKVAEAGFKVTPRQVSDEGYAHNIAINEDSGYAYLVGSNNCAGGLYMLDLSHPLSPSAAGCFSDWGWISDAQCVTYDGPDSDYRSREICFITYLYGIAVVDVTNKSSPHVLSFLGESFFNLIDQGWLTEDKKYFLVGDRRGGDVRTYLVDVSNLDNITIKNTYQSSLTARHGNNFVKGNYLYQANHRGGLRVLDLSNIFDGDIDEVGFFDTTPNKSGSGQDGVQGVYPFFRSGVVIISSEDEGLFLTRPSFSSPSLECSNNSAGSYPCMDISLTSLLPTTTFRESDSGRTADIWGWTDSRSGKEYAIVGFRDGTAFVDISSPSSPIYLGFLKAHDDKVSVWRDIKTYNDYAFIIADAVNHGMQIFDLRQLSSISSVPTTFRETAHFEINSQGWRFTDPNKTNFDRFYAKVIDAGEKVVPRQVSDEGYAHNIAINKDSQYAYLLGSNNCNGGLYMLDLSNPLSPSAAGCFSEWGWINDAQCVTYDGPDSDYRNREICFVSYSIGVGVIDVTNKSNPRALSFLEDPNFNSVDQGWLTEDKKYFLVGDRTNGARLRTYIVNVSNLDNISIDDTYITSLVALHGNNFVKGDYLYQANHREGLRILDLSDVSDGDLNEVGYFDTTPTLSQSGQDGVRGVYPFFSSGVVIVSSVNEGLFILDFSPVINFPSLPECINSARDYLQVDVQVDDFGSADGNSYILSYYKANQATWKELTRKRSFENNERHIWGSCERKRECYRLVLNDNHGDGICCENGNGFYNIDFDGVRKSGTFDGGNRLIEYVGDCDSVPT